MIEFRYSQEKDAKLIDKYNLSFSDIIQTIKDGNVLLIREHHNKELYPNQKILYVRIIEEVYAVPHVLENSNSIFLKTFYPSRKARKLLFNSKYLELTKNSFFE